VFAALDREQRESLYALLQLATAETPASCVAAEASPA
jgi:hypothetical protein